MTTHIGDGKAEAAPARLKRTAAISAVLSAMTLVVVDAGGTNIALPSIAASLHMAPSTAILVVTAYQVAVVMALLPSAAMGEQFGLRRVFTAGVITFIAAAVMAAAAPSLSWLLVARFAQGLGASAILALGVALLRSTVSDHLLGAAIAWNAMTVALAAAAGPALGALVLSELSWNWLYVFELPLGFLALLATRSLPLVESSNQRLDYVSIGLNFAAFGLLIVGLNIAVLHFAAATCLILASGLVFSVLVAREAKRARPLVPLDLLRGAAFRTSILASVSCFVGQTAGLIALPFYLQHSMGLSPPLAGLYLTVWPLSVAVAAFTAKRWSRWASTSTLCAIGAGLLAAGLFGAASWPASNTRLFVPYTVAAGVGFGLFQIANNRNMFLAAPITRSGAAGGMQGTARLLGQAGGSALVAQLFMFTPTIEAPRFAMSVAAAFALVAGIISLFGSRPDARSIIVD